MLSINGGRQPGSAASSFVKTGSVIGCYPLEGLGGGVFVSVPSTAMSLGWRPAWAEPECTVCHITGSMYYEAELG